MPIVFHGRVNAQPHSRSIPYQPSSWFPVPEFEVLHVYHQRDQVCGYLDYAWESLGTISIASIHLQVAQKRYATYEVRWEVDPYRFPKATDTEDNVWLTGNRRAFAGESDLSVSWLVKIWLHPPLDRPFLAHGWGYQWKREKYDHIAPGFAPHA